MMVVIYKLETTGVLDYIFSFGRSLVSGDLRAVMNVVESMSAYRLNT